VGYKRLEAYREFMFEEKGESDKAGERGGDEKLSKGFDERAGSS
jgi:hypothetical protein